MPVDFRGAHVSHTSYVRYRYANYWLGDAPLLVMTSVAFLALILAIVAICSHHLQQGFSTATLHKSSVYRGDGAIPVKRTFNFGENFLFRFLPVLLMSSFSVVWSFADHQYRSTCPFAKMDAPAPASSSILLDYPTCMPGAVTIKALRNHHWRVALFSLLSLMSPVAPIVATGIFFGSLNASQIVVRIQSTNFWATFAILIVYIVCLPFARPTAPSRMPHLLNNVADVTLLCYESKIYDDPIFSVQDATDERIHLESRVNLAKLKYQFGLYLGRDGRRHLGFDVAEKQHAGKTVYVNSFIPPRCFYPFGNGAGRLYFRHPQLSRKIE